MQKHEYIIVHRIDKSTLLDEHIPLHMTALHWFVSDREQDEIISAFRSALRDTATVITHANREDMFGPEHDIPVTRLERTPELLSLHLALEAAFRHLGAKLEERWVGEKNWNPHVTHQPEGRLFSGDEVHITDLDLITKRANGMRELVARGTLGV